MASVLPSTLTGKFPRYKTGDKVPESGIYTVIHDPAHAENHEVTCIEGKQFPPCRDCKSPRFVLKRAAVHIADHPMLKPGIKRLTPVKR